MKKEYIEKIYSGWLAKIIGIRAGAPNEGWTYEKIQQALGVLDGYLAPYKTFAADDDSNGPLFFLRAVEDSGNGENVTAQDVGKALLNYAPFEHGFFWWGGYGISTEHTAYLNLRNGIEAPRSGSIEQNGAAAAEQIGGQIFIDSWGLVNPGNPERAAKMAEKAASVTHGGNGVYGGMFIAACIAQAFVENDIEKIIEKSLTLIPEDCEYARMVRIVVDYYHAHPEDWRACYHFIHDNYGYDKYPGACHIIPNIAVMILGLLYGRGDFDDTINITNMCGWDTDCNVGNVATIMGVILGTEAIDYNKWRKPVDDLLICSSCVGSLNIQDIPFGALYMLKIACMLNGEEVPEPYRSILDKKIDMCYFEYPGSTHHIMARQWPAASGNQDFQYHTENSTEAARTGERSLKFSTISRIAPAEKVLIYKKTYYQASDFSDSRYDPEFSPTVYPGQTLHVSVMVPEYGYSDGFMDALVARLYVHDEHTDTLIESDPVKITKGEWTDLTFRIPSLEGVLLDEMGVSIDTVSEHRNRFLSLTCFIDDLYADGTPDYTLDLSKEKADYWGGLHTNYTQFVKLKGLMYLADGMLNLSCADFAEAYTGGYDWKDYSAAYTVIPVTGSHHYVNARVQGAIRSYAAALLPDNRFAILKNDFGYQTLASCDFTWENGKEYEIRIMVKGNEITAEVGGTRISVIDEDHAYLQGSIGIAMEHGSHMKLKKIVVKPEG